MVAHVGPHPRSLWDPHAPVLAVDPGPDESAVVRIVDGMPTNAWIGSNEDVLRHLTGHGEHLAIEMVASYGMSVGREVFETCVWIGRFIQAHGGPYSLVYRSEVKCALCGGNQRAKDSNVRQALLDRYPRFGGGKTPQVGTKSRPGPLYGLRSHMWSALAVGVTWIERGGGR